MSGAGGAGLGARGLALRILADVAEGGFVDRALAEREARLEDPRDRRFLHNLVLTSLRWQGALDARLDRFVHGGARRLEPPVRAALRTGLTEASLMERPPAIAVSATVDAVRDVAGQGAARLVNAVLRRALARGAPALDPERTIPRWLLERWRAAFGADAARAMIERINEPARAFIVARPGGDEPGALLERLESVGVRARRAPWHPRGVEVLSGSPAATGCFDDGSAVAVDPAAALVARLAVVPAGGPVADLAAAPGGKAILLGWECDAPLALIDRDATRIERAHPAVSHALGPARVAAVQADAANAPLRDGTFALVLLDAPCTGTGTLRRRPDRRWRLRPGAVREAARVQGRLLRTAARLVRPGGALVYAVCSLEPEEGEEQADRFLAAHASFRAVDPAPLLPDAARPFLDPGSAFLRTRPDLAPVDGFFAVRMERAPA